MKKEEYIKYVNDNFVGKTKELLINQIDKFYEYKDNFELDKHSYKLGDDVYLKKGTFMHGTYKNMDGLDIIAQDGFTTGTFRSNEFRQKYPYCVGFWNIQKDMMLSDYINLYSGCTIEFVGDGYRTEADEEIKRTKLIAISDIENEIKNNDYSKWFIEQTKEARFLPNLQKNYVQIGFILNMESKEAKSLLEGDIFRLDFDKEILKSFVVDKIYNHFINDIRDDFFTNRESAIVFGIPPVFIEGVLVGRIYEKDNDKLDYIKSKLPNAYICNLDGKVIRE